MRKIIFAVFVSRATAFLLQTARVGKYNTLIVIVFCCGCYEQKPPEGYEAVFSENVSHSRRGCPNLIGTYLLDSKNQLNQFLQKIPDQDDFRYFIIDSLVSDLAYTFKLRRSEVRFTQAAQEFRFADPKGYYQWREVFLKQQANPNKMPMDTPKAIEAFDALKRGPVFEHPGQFRIYECDNGWIKVNVSTSGLQSQEELHISQRDDTWLARDKYGNLLIHTIRYKRSPGGRFLGIRTADNVKRISDMWSKINVAPDSTFTQTWTNINLPAIAKPVTHASECFDASRIARKINQDLVNQGTLVEKFSIQRAEIRNHYCTKPAIILDFLTENSLEAQQTLKELKQYPNVENIEILETRPKKKQLYYQVKIHINPPVSN